MRKESSNRALASALARVRSLARQGRVQFTYKALWEIAELDLGLDECDVVDILSILKKSDFVARLRSTTEWLYVFKPHVFDVRIYLKVAIRRTCLVISFHEDMPEREFRYGEEE